jgi:nucleoside-diphosphate-sugar epimerase
VGESNDFGVYSNVIHKFIEQGKRGEPISVYGTGSAIMNYVWISDVTKSLISIGNSNLRDTFNVGNMFNFTILEIGELISKKFGVDIEHLEKDWTEGIARIGNIEKAQFLLGISNRMSLEEMVDKILESQEELL